MIVLGISGAVGFLIHDIIKPFKGNSHISPWVHGASASLAIHGELVGTTTEERFTRNKYDGQFPENSITSLLKYHNVRPEDVDIVGFVDSVSLQCQMAIESGYPHKIIKNMFPNAKVELVRHHLAHASQAFFTSEFDSATVMTWDGSGSGYCRPGDYFEANCFTFGKFKKNVNGAPTDITFYKRGNKRNGQDLFYLPNFYSLVSKSILEQYLNIENTGDRKYRKFVESAAGKVMGMAAYSDLDLDIINPLALDNRTHLICQDDPESMPDFYCTSGENFDWIMNTYGQLNDSTITHFDRACLLQKMTEKSVVQYLNKIPDSYKEDNFCYGGGLALNILVNSEIARNCGFKQIHIAPAPNDEGLSQGALLYLVDKFTPDTITLPKNLSCIGLSYSNNHIEDVISSCDQIEFKKVENEDILYDLTSAILAENNIVAWYQGRSESGPRALGNRSIFANPMHENKEVLNEKVKFREFWRPYAAMVLTDQVHEWFDLPVEKSDYMMFSSIVKEDKLNTIPGVVHVDKTCRIQTVNENLNYRATRLLKNFHEKTGVPLLLNTSFNTIPGEPIVETPEDALRSFLYSNIDCLVIGDYIVRKKENYGS